MPITLKLRQYSINCKLKNTHLNIKNCLHYKNNVLKLGVMFIEPSPKIQPQTQYFLPNLNSKL